MDWDKLRIFHAVAEKGSLTHAGDVLHLSQSAVSRQIRALENPALAGVPILAMTANAFDEDRRRAMESGMNGFLSKPIVIGDLVQELHKIL